MGLYIVIAVSSFLLNFKSVLSADLKMDKDASFNLISSSSIAFSSNLYQALSLSQTQENIIVSTLSAHIILSLLFNGAEGVTKEELQNSLHLFESDELEKEYSFLLKSLNVANKSELELVNAMYIDDKFIISDNFINKSKVIFFTSVNHLNFKNSIDSATYINSWIEQKTRGKLSNVISSNAIDEYVKVILISALYFKSSWLNPFDSESTKIMMFHNINNIKTYVPTMSKTFNVLHGHINNLDAKFIKLKYSDENFEMIILLPNEKQGLSKLEQSFDWKLISNAPCSMKEVEVFLPKFKIEATVDLKTTLKQIGITSIFKETANFSFMTDKSVHVGEIFQKIFIEVDEKGSEAAVATVAKIRSRRMIVATEIFAVDHPFMFLIQHTPSSIPLFTGSIRKLGHSKDEL